MTDDARAAVPPSWSSRFEEYFSGLKSWILDSAFPALVQGPLRSDPDVAGLPEVISTLEHDLREARPIPVALVGLTGVGKSTLLNALLEEEFLPVGVIGSQTAAFVTISYAPDWEITCEYIGEHELDQIYLDAATPTDDQAEVGSPEIRDKAERKIRALLGLREADQLPALEELQSGPPDRFRDIVRQGRRRFLGHTDCKRELVLHAKHEHWPITRMIDVRGPFEMLRSGVVISDLPGAGDLNLARAAQSRAAITDAGQVLIAVDARLLQQSLMDQLETVGRLPNRLFQEHEKVQIILVGTSLDKGMPDAQDDRDQVLELGLDPDTATNAAIFSSICFEWSRRIREQFVLWLRTQASLFLPDASVDEREATIQRILASVAVVATSAKDWVKYRRGKPMAVAVDPEKTGIPELRRRINELADSQIKTTVGLFERRLEELRSTVLMAIERSESMLGADIEGILMAVSRSRQRMQEVQDEHVQIVSDLRMSVLDAFQQVRETLIDKIRIASLRMRNDGRRQVQEHLKDLHWASLRATVHPNNGGLWVTSKNRTVNLRDAMGGEVTRLVPQAWSKVVDEKIGRQIAGAKESVLDTLRAFTARIRGVVDGELGDELSQKTVATLLEASHSTAESKMTDFATKVTSLLGQTSRQMQQRVDKAVDESLLRICEACSDDRGTGWKLRSVTRIIDATEIVAEQTERRCTEIADQALDDLRQAVYGFCEAAATEMNKIGSSIPDVLSGAVERSRLLTPQAQKAILETARRGSPAAWHLISQT